MATRESTVVSGWLEELGKVGGEAARLGSIKKREVSRDARYGHRGMAQGSTCDCESET